ncbi:AP-4 complex subunit epsilon-1 [Aplysia californica]|uniref:AP-4 complex subunit epsilon-1 n=1 Tax=Aplysia californica TaxID=6500 RepID=A0ABM0K5T6_APLCA|nr:AP-4 complex subunit epsilon-1 [Aplysia californica]
MSQIMERTLASLPKLLSQGLSGGKSSKSSGPSPLSLDVQNFMKHVHRARSKTQESNIIASEMATVQQKLKQSEYSASPAFMRSVFSKAIFCHLLGYDVSFVTISAINLAQQGQGYDKQLGYLVSSLLLNPSHHMAMLMMATLLRDLKSSNMADNMVALVMAAHLVDVENVPTLLPAVTKKLSHPHDLVREKAVHCLRAFYQRSPDVVQSSLGQLNSLLSSRDPGVLSAVVNTYLLMCEKNPSKLVGLGRSFLHILHQVNSRGFGASYYHHMVPLPWLQVSLLKVLSLLGSCDAQVSTAVIPHLEGLMEKTKVSEPASLAVLVESVVTATRLTGADSLMPLCSRCVGKLLEPQAGPDMRYQGLGLLAALVRVKPSLATQHQAAVVASLQDPDPAVQQRTAQILHAMANRANVKAICSKLFQQIDETEDKVFISDMFKMIADLTERFSADMDWYVRTVFYLLQHPDNVYLGEDLIQAVVSRVEQFCLGSHSLDGQGTQAFLSVLFDVLDNSESSQKVVVLALHLLGIFAPRCGGEFPSERLLDAVDRILFPDPGLCAQPLVIIPSPVPQDEAAESVVDSELEAVCCACVEGLCRLVLMGCVSSDVVKSWLHRHDDREPRGGNASRCRLLELCELIALPLGHLPATPELGSHWDVDSMDFSLSFLDGLVVQDILAGASVFKPRVDPSPNSLLAGDVIVAGNEMESSVSVASEQAVYTSTESALLDSWHESTAYPPVRGKWREDADDDDDDFEDHEEVEADMEDASNKGAQRTKSDLTLDLFAGLSLDPVSVTKRTHSDGWANSRRGKNIWDDDEDEESDSVKMRVAGFDLHPFGIPSKKSKLLSCDDTSMISSDEFDMMSPQTISTNQMGSQKFPPVSNKWSESSLYSNTLKNVSLSGLNNNLYDMEEGSHHIAAHGDESIYADSVAATINSASTVDDLTDSEPEAS